MHGTLFVVLTGSTFSRYVDRIANAKWEVKDLGLDHNGYVLCIIFSFETLSLLSFSLFLSLALEYIVTVVDFTCDKCSLFGHSDDFVDNVRFFFGRLCNVMIAQMSNRD